MVDSKQFSSLLASIGSYFVGDTVSVMTFQENITFLLQNTAFLVSIAAGLLTIYYAVKKHCDNRKKNGNEA
jgi:hypothetical protein